VDLPVSPKYLMTLVTEVEQALSSLDPGDQEAAYYYIKKWHAENQDWNNHWENFTVFTLDNSIDIRRTLHSMPGDILIQMAVDLGVHTPDFIPSVPQIKNEIKQTHLPAYAAFEKALKEVETHPDSAIGLANATLESIIKEILKDERISVVYDKGKTLYALSQDVLKAFGMYPSAEMPSEFKMIGSAFLSICQGIEKLRSEMTSVHGKSNDEVVISNPLYAYFVVNSVTTVGLFLKAFYKKEYPPEITPVTTSGEEDELPF
jgi:hypothetical protein